MGSLVIKYGTNTLGTYTQAGAPSIGYGGGI